MTMPEEMAAIVSAEERSLLATLTKSGQPITLAIDHLWGEDNATIDYGTGLSYPAKADRARANPHVGLLFHRGQSEGFYLKDPSANPYAAHPALAQRPPGSLLVIAAEASVEDADLQATTDRWVRFRLTPDAVRAPFGRSKLPDEGWADAVFYWVRVFINCTPKVAYLWPDGRLDAAPQIWRATADVVAAPSDPAPSGPPTAATTAPREPWEEVARRVVGRGDLLAPYLTLASEDGYPLPFWTHGVEAAPEGFALDVPKGAPWPLRGKGCLNFEGQGGYPTTHQDGFTGTVHAHGDRVVFEVDHALPGPALGAKLADGKSSHMRPPDDVRAKSMERLHAELARRGASLPLVRRPEDM